MIDINWSPSASLSSFFDTNNSKYKLKSNFNSDISKVREELSRTANMLSNDSTTERSFSVKFSDGSTPPVFGGNEFTISPNLILKDKTTIKSGKEYYNALDALNGRVILGTQIAKNVSKEDYRQFSESTDSDAKDTFQAINERVAAKKLHDEWPGFRPYLQKHADICHPKKSEYDSCLPSDVTKDQLKQIMAVANYNLLNPDDQITTGNEGVDNLISDFNSQIDQSFESCKNAIDWLRSQLKDSKLDKDPSGEGESGDSEDDDKDSSESDGSGESDEDSSADAKDSKDDGTEAEGKEVKTPKAFDSELMGDNPIKSMRGDLSDIKSDDQIAEEKLLGMSFRIRLWTDRETARKFDCDSKTAITRYDEFVKSHQNSIKEVEKCFLFEDNTPAIYSRGMSAGDIDDANLWKMRLGDYQYLYERKDINKAQKHCVGILLDLSGSMRHGRIRDAREVVMMLVEGLRSYPSIKPLVYGHTGQINHHEDVDMVPYIDEFGNDKRHWLAVSEAQCQNIDGTAIKDMAERIKTVQDVQNRYMLVISDGEPSGDNYGHEPAYKHTRMAVDKARRDGIKVYGIGICNAFGPSMGAKLYGEGNYCILSDTKSSLRVMVNKLRSFMAK